MPSGLKVFCANSHPSLTAEVCRSLGIEVGQCQTGRFSDGEFNFQILENVRGQDCFLIQPTCPPVDQNILELLIMLDAFRRSSAARITAVIPYYGYARKDRKDKPRVPISSKLIANLIVQAGADRVLCMDLHAGQIQAFFDIPVDHIFAAPVLVGHFQHHPIPDLVVVAPDAGGVERARAYAKRLDVDLAIIDKRRDKDKANVVDIMHVIGEVAGKNVLIVDDMIDTAGTLTQSAQALRDNGAKEIYACATHAVFSGRACELIAESVLSQVVVTNTIPERHDVCDTGKVTYLSIAGLLADAIASIHDETSVSRLFI